MKIVVVAAITTGPQVVSTEHNGESIEWNVTTLARINDKQRPRDHYKMFDEINAYFETLPQERLNIIWDCYKQARQIFDAIEGSFQLGEENTEQDLRLASRLGKIARVLYGNIPQEEITHWRRFRGNIRVPPTLKDTFDETGTESSKYKPATTYLLPEYLDLVDLTIGLRPMLPILGEYVRSVKEDTGNSFKEYYSLRLLRGTWVADCPATARLTVYIEGLIEHEMKQARNKVEHPFAKMTLSGISDVEFPLILLGMTLARRLLTAEISSTDERSHLVTNLHQFISSKIKPNAIDKNFGDKKFGAKLAAKTAPKDKSEENQPSLIEMNKVKQQLSDGDIVALQHYVRDPYRLAEDVDPGIPRELVTLCLEGMRNMSNKPIEPHHVNLVQYALAKAIRPRSVQLLTRPLIHNAMAVAQAAYCYWEFPVLGVLVTATSIRADDSNRMLGAEGMKDVSRDFNTQFEIYPEHSGKRQSWRDANAATRAIGMFSDRIAGNQWLLNCPDMLLDLVPRAGSSRRMETPAEFQNILAQFCVKISTK